MSQPADAGRGAPAPVLVVDYGAQYTQLIARRVREAHVYSEIVPHTAPAREILARRPRALVLSGGPESVYAPGAPRADPSVDTSSVLFQGQPARQVVWMSHGDSVVRLPPGCQRTAWTASTQVAAFEAPGRGLYAVQWHPEVAHSEHGQRLVENFLYRAAGIEPTWTTGNIIDGTVKAVAQRVGHHQVIAGLSGGVDSAVAAALVQRAVGDQLTCVFVDHGLLREGEREQVEQDYVRATGVKLHVVHAERQFLQALASLPDPADPEAKRKAIGREFIRAFEQAATEVVGRGREVKFLVQGTLYPDVVESGGGEGAASIKTHHNVGGLPADLRFELVEPLRRLFKDEVRAVGEELGLPHEIVWRQPFPGPGLAIRVVGAVTEDRLRVLRRADAIAREELSAAGLDR